MVVVPPLSMLRMRVFFVFSQCESHFCSRLVKISSVTLLRLFLLVLWLFLLSVNSTHAMVVFADLFASGFELKLSMGWILSNPIYCLSALEVAYPSVPNLGVIDPLDSNMV
jgi:hypothetical protein